MTPTWSSLFRHFKFFRLLVLLHGADEALRAHSAKASGYCYIIGRGAITLLLGHVTRLPFFLYLKIFLTCIFTSVVF